MSERKILPNAVGRLDNVTAAIRTGDRNLAASLLKAEVERRQERFKAVAAELERERKGLVECQRVHGEISSGDMTVGEWTLLRQLCGWNPGYPATF